MPPSEDHWEFRFFRLDGARNLNGFLDHRSRDNRNSQTDRLIDLVENFLLELRIDRRVDDLDAVTLTLEHWRQCQ